MKKPYTIGAEAMRKIQAVEGIVVTDEDMAFLESIKELPEAERIALMVAYAKRHASERKPE